MTCGFEYTHRWAQIAPLFLSGDPGQVAEAVRLLEDRDRELELWSNGICDCCNPAEVLSFPLDDADESGPKGHVDVDIEVPDGTGTITVTFTADAANPSIVLDFIRVTFDPLGTGTPAHSEFPGTAGPTDCAISDSFAAGAATVRVFAQSGGASSGDLVDYSIAYS